MSVENPFTLKVGQVFTGFGIGCGIGLGVGRPLNLGTIPVLNQVMVATRGATDAFSNVGRHVNNSLRKVGAKKLEAGIGCGVGFGHGIGVGLAVKPGVVHRMQLSLLQAVTHVMIKLGISPGLFVDQGILPASLRSGMSMVKETSQNNLIGSMGQLVKSIPNSTEQGNIRQRSINVVSSLENLAPETDAVNTQSTSRVEKVISNFLENPLLKEEGKVNEHAEKMQSQNNLLQMVLKHQVLIDELMQENEKLCQILIEELKVPPSKLQSSFAVSKSPCSECFICRRKQRKKVKMNAILVFFSSEKLNSKFNSFLLYLKLEIGSGEKNLVCCRDIHSSTQIFLLWEHFRLPIGTK